MSRHKSVLPFLGGLVLLLIVSCKAAPTATPTPTVVPKLAGTPHPTRTPSPVSTPAPTPTPSPVPIEVPTLSAEAQQARQLAAAGVSRNADWVPYFEEIDGVKMALVPAGCFMMGTTDAQLDDVFEFCEGQPETGVCDRTEFKGEQPVHKVCFDRPFWVDVTEVTNGQFQAQAGQAAASSQWADADRPRENITWAEAAAFCQKRGARLLSEAEWEYAARGPDGLVYPWGNEFLADNVVYSENSDTQTAAAGSNPGGVSWIGALDLSGNVWEWVNDWWGTYPSEQQTRPGGPDNGAHRVLRGGAWDRNIGRIRAAIRGRDDPKAVSSSAGFRCGMVERGDVLALAWAGVTRNADWASYTEKINGVEMALVPAGCFMMGTNDEQLTHTCEQTSGIGACDTQALFGDEQPAHRVCFDEPFWVDVYEVTQAQFAQFGGEAAKASTFTGDNLPQENVTWAEADAFCQKRGARLLHEAQWEYAARGPDGLIYPWGNEFVADNVVKSNNSDGRTWEVGSKPGGLSWIGAFDMSGNVWEWVIDFYSHTYYGSLSDGAVNPSGPATGEISCRCCSGEDFRVMRGGSWHPYDIDVRTALRFGVDPNLQYSDDIFEDVFGGNVGFRCGSAVSDVP